MAVRSVGSVNVVLLTRLLLVVSGLLLLVVAVAGARVVRIEACVDVGADIHLAGGRVGHLLWTFIIARIGSEIRFMIREIQQQYPESTGCSTVCQVIMLVGLSISNVEIQFCSNC